MVTACFRQRHTNIFLEKGLDLYAPWLQQEQVKRKKQWFWFGPSWLICTFQFQLKRREQGLESGVSIRAIVQRKGDGKKWLILKKQCALLTQLQYPPSITSPFLSYFLSLVPLHPPSTPRPPMLPGSSRAFNTCTWKGQLCERPELSSHPQDASACPVQ